MKKLAFLGTDGTVAAPERFDLDTLINIVGQNSGNLVFQYAATKIVPSFAPGLEVHHLSLSHTPYTAPDALTGVDLLVFPAANHFRPKDVDWSRLSSYLEGAKRPLIVLGLGAQASSKGEQDEALHAIVNNPEVARLAAVIRKHARLVTVRGQFSKQVCDAFGIDNAVVLGCPSFLINDDPELGVKFAKRLDDLRSGAMPIGRFGVTAAAPWEIYSDEPKRSLEQKLVAWAYENDALYIQQSGGRDVFNYFGGKRSLVDEAPQKSIHKVLAPHLEREDWEAYSDRNSRLYYSVPEWMQEMTELSFVIGTRLHGNMAAIGAGTPGIIIAHDARTNELQETMHLPTVLMEDVMASETINDVLAKVKFDADSFDKARAKARAYLKDAIQNILGETQAA